MRRILLSLTVFLTVGLFLQPGFHSGGAQALTIGPITFPDIDPPVTIDQSKPTVIAKPTWMPELTEDDTVILIPGTTDYDGADQLNRTRDIGMFGVDPAHQPTVQVVNYPAAFGFTIGDFPIYLAGTGTFNESVEIGTAKGVAAAEAAYAANPDQKIVINGYSQSAPVAMDVAYMLRQRGTIPDEKIIVVLGADSRFPNTGVENVVPSFIPGMYTNGDRDTADTGDVEVHSYCVRGDATCGVGNPFANPVSTFFYLIPGFYVHAFLTYRINEYDVAKTWTENNTTYTVYDGGNPWGMVLRDLGVPVPKEFDDFVSAVVPVPMPGEQATIAGHVIPTPRELQDIVADKLGLTVPVTDPDRNPDVEDRLRDDTTADDSTTAPPAAPPTTPARTSTDPADVTPSSPVAETASADESPAETPDTETPNTETPDTDAPDTGSDTSETAAADTETSDASDADGSSSESSDGGNTSTSGE
ncbi:cutinase family protein [Gordonia insulae]|uniref:Uncharacterized protein n=1 Tax=Gordonia insulae TaxID=2420509 RepID=A0A3G8JPM3_9ACTN|nr:PE-PPE domain-containing protein [Gordonia insulae]AZG46429.1 hypothetical protein D7316_03030 [Gordonia insulae]